MNKFKLYIAAVAVGVMPTIAFANALENVIPGYQAAGFVTHKFDVDPNASVDQIPKLATVTTTGEGEEGPEGGVICAKKQRQLAAQAAKHLTGEDSDPEAIFAASTR